VLILQALNEGLGVNAVCRLFHVGKNSLYRWQERLSDLKPTLLLYALCHQFLNLVVEGDEVYTKVKKTFPPLVVKIVVAFFHPVCECPAGTSITPAVGLSQTSVMGFQLRIALDQRSG
jgi:hypothetical protein